MDTERARQIVYGPYQPKKSSVGFYRPSKEFLAHTEHISVMEDESGKLLAITGPVVPEEEDSNLRSLCEAVVYSGSFEMFNLIKSLARGETPRGGVKAAAQTVVESLRHKMDDLEPSGVSPDGLRNSIMIKLGILKKPEIGAPV